MKKALSLLLFLCVLFGACALAEGKLEVTQEAFQAVEYFTDTYYGCLYAEITNTSDKPLAVDEGSFQLTGTDGAVLALGSVYSSYPNVVAPGATAFISAREEARGAAKPEDVAGYSFVMTSDEPYGDGPSMLTVLSAEYGEIPSRWGDTDKVVSVVVQNDTDAIVYNPSFSFGLYDEAGKLLFADSQSVYNLGIPAGQSVVLTYTMGECYWQAWETAGQTVSSVKAIAYLEY